MHLIWWEERYNSVWHLGLGRLFLCSAKTNGKEVRGGRDERQSFVAKVLDGRVWDSKKVLKNIDEKQSAFHVCVSMSVCMYVCVCYERKNGNVWVLREITWARMCCGWMNMGEGGCYFYETLNILFSAPFRRIARAIRTDRAPLRVLRGSTTTTMKMNI